MSNCQYMDLITNSNFRAFLIRLTAMLEAITIRNTTYTYEIFYRIDRIISYIFYPCYPFNETTSHLYEVQIVIARAPYCDEKCRLRSVGQVFRLRRHLIFFLWDFHPESSSVRAHFLLPAYYPLAKILSVEYDKRENYRRLSNFLRHRARGISCCGDRVRECWGKGWREHREMEKQCVCFHTRYRHRYRYGDTVKAKKG